MDVPSNVLARIKKLLSLADSSNENEAAAAASKAQELMFKYNLEISAVENLDLRPDEKVDQHNFDIGLGEGKKNVANWKSWLFVAVAQTSMCQPYIAHGYRTTYARVIGRKAVVEVAQYTYSWLIHELERLSNAYMANQIWFDQYDSRRMRRSWLEGASLGVSRKLRADFDARKVETEQSTALVVVRDKEIQDWMDDNGLQLTSRKATVASQDRRAYTAGYQAGSNLSVTRGVTGGTTQRIGG